MKSKVLSASIGGLCLAYTFIQVSPETVFAQEISGGTDRAKGELSVEVDGNQANLSAKDVELNRLFAELGRKSDVEFVIYADDFRRKISLEIGPVHLVRAIETILETAAAGDYAFQYIADHSSHSLEFLNVDKVYIVKKSWKEEEPPADIASVEEVGSLLLEIEMMHSGRAKRDLLEMGRSAVPALLEIVKVSEGAFDTEASSILIEIGDSSVLPELYELYELYDKQEGSGARYLARAPTKRAEVGHIIQKLEAKEFYDSFPFEDMSEAENAVVLVDMLKMNYGPFHKDEALSNWAGEKMLEGNGVAKELLLRELSEGENQRLRQTGMKIVKEFGRREGYGEYYPLLEKMLFSENISAHSAAMKVLIKIDEEESRALLLKSMTTNTTYLSPISEVLAKMGDERAIPILIEHLKADQYRTYSRAQGALLHFGERAVEQLNDEYDVSSPEVQRRILVVLGELRKE